MHSDRYNTVSIWLHWSVAALVIAQFVTGWTDALFERGSGPRMFIFRTHLALGTATLLLAIARLGWRLTHPAPPLPKGTSRAQAFAAKTMHALLYVLILVQPVLGLLTVTTFGKSLGRWPHSLHLQLANVIAAVVILHVLAALWHHLILKDGLIARMKPGRARRRTYP